MGLLDDVENGHVSAARDTGRLPPIERYVLESALYEAGARPAPPCDRGLEGTDGPELARAWAFAASLRRRLIRFDWNGAREVLTRWATLADVLTDDEARAAFSVSLGLADAFFATSGAPDARPSRRPSTRIEGVSAHALRCLEDGEEDALRYARRASRMSRTEALPQSEYLANVVLARVRRVLGQTHRAAHILMSLAKFVSAGWRGWIGWELVLCGRRDEALQVLAESPPTPAAEATRALARGLEAAEGGDEPAFAESCTALLRQHGAFVRPDLEMLLSTMRYAPTASPTAFSTGEDAALPARVSGLAAASSRAPERAILLSTPQGGVRRLFFSGLANLRRQMPSVQGLADVAQAARMDTAICVLAGAPEEGLAQGDAFKAIYRFNYLPEAHSGTFRALLHRLRKRLQHVARVERERGRLKLCTLQPFWVVDPRCQPEVGASILSVLAQHQSSAKELSARLRVPLRTVQTALGSLVEDGGCLRERRGNDVRYRLEDTTFSEPTRVRKAAQG